VAWTHNTQAQQRIGKGTKAQELSMIKQVQRSTTVQENIKLYNTYQSSIVILNEKLNNFKTL
jgi:hypothetical protein